MVANFSIASESESFSELDASHQFLCPLRSMAKLKLANCEPPASALTTHQRAFDLSLDSLSSSCPFGSEAQVKAHNQWSIKEYGRVGDESIETTGVKKHRHLLGLCFGVH